MIPCKFYMSLSSFTVDEAISEIFNTFNVEYEIINTIKGESLLICLIRDSEQVDSFITAMDKFKPTLIGKYKKDGNPIGIEDIQSKVGEDIIVEKVGTATLTFNKVKYLALAKDDVVYNTVGEITSVVSKTRPVKVKQYHNFAGWENDKEY